ncbi:MAG TPA: hypothetical protein VGL15_11095 [Vicinamibacteria bacterium]
MRLNPESAVNARTYGVQFINYFPYYYQGLAHLHSGDWSSAILMFNIEEKQGAIKKSSLFRELLRRRSEAEKGRADAEDAETRKKLNQLRDEVTRLRREAGDLHKAGRTDDALARLASAQKAAEALDSDTRRDIAESIKKIREDAREATERAVRAQRVEQALGEARKLLQEGRGAEAKVRFDDVLALDPRSAAALAGKQEAEAQILATTTKQAREALLQQGRGLIEAGRYKEAIAPLTEAAADPTNLAAAELLAKARKTVEGMRQARDQRVRIDQLLQEAERLLAERKFPEAWVRLESVLDLDHAHARARERLSFAQRMTGEAIFETIFPNRPPVLNFFERPAAEMEGPSLTLVGVASDDRGLARLEFRLGGQTVGEKPAPIDAESGEPSRTLSFEQVFPLKPGPNEIRIAAYDSLGKSRVETFPITRRLRFYETRAFVPSAAAGAVGLLGVGVAAQRMRRRRAIRSRFNPYIAGAPVIDDDMFFGRQKLLARIMNVLHHNSLMITGERRIGKTTFLYHLKKALAGDEGTEYKFFPVFTDLQGVTEDGFFHAVMLDVVDSLRLTAQTHAALRFQPEDERYDGRDFSHDLQRVIEELKTRTDRRVKLALLIDEVDVLNEYSERINQRLRSIFMKTFSEHLVAIMSGVGIRRIWNSEGSPWYNFFDEIELTAFTREEAEALVREPVEGVFRYEPEAVEAILTQSRLRPYLIQKLCIHAVNRMLEAGRAVVTTADVEAAREAVQFESREEPAAAVGQTA